MRCSVCNQTAFYLDGAPLQGDYIGSHQWFRLDWTPYVLGEELFCGSCGERTDLDVTKVERINIR